MEEGLYITINSDDPPMFNTTLTNEYIVGQKSFNWGQDTLEQLVLNAVNVTLLPENEREIMYLEFKAAFERLKTESKSGQRTEKY
jgi:adenosine deaminase